jgi:hypothetical protein
MSNLIMKLTHKLIYKSGVKYYLHLNNNKHGDGAKIDKLNTESVLVEIMQWSGWLNTINGKNK